MTKRFGSLEREVIKSSVMPSLKYSCSRSSLMLVKGSTAIEGLPGSGRAGDRVVGIEAVVVGGRSESRSISTITAITSVIPKIDARMPVRFFGGGLPFVIAAELVSTASTVGLASATGRPRHGPGYGGGAPTSRNGAQKR